MRIRHLVFLLLLLQLNLKAETITVKQDGSGDHISIQLAINSASFFDTILVYPGTYYENIVINTKSLHLASLALTTGDESYRNTTIIDGSNQGSCIALSSTNPDVETYIHGFTIKNGSGTYWESEEKTYGGGIFVDEELFVSIENCIIKDNISNDWGGGICVIWFVKCEIKNCKIFNNKSLSGGGIGLGLYIQSYLEGNSIYGNHTSLGGGGLATGYQVDISFDSLNRCSIYDNFGARGCDISKAISNNTQIYLDTMTVNYFDPHFIYNMDINGFVSEDSLQLFVRYAYLEPINSNLYVDPLLGDENNSGTSLYEPLKSIADAYRKIVVDSLNPKTIYLANGIYSDTLSGEKYPLNIRQFVNLEGESMNGVILDGEHKTYLMRSNNTISDYSLSKMTLRRGGVLSYNEQYETEPGLMLLYWQGENITIDSITFTQAWTRYGGGNHNVGVGPENGFIMRNCIFKDNVGSRDLLIGGFTDFDTLYVSNCIFDGLKPDSLNLDGLSVALGIGNDNADVLIVINCLFTNNERQTITASYGSWDNNVKKNYFINNTIVNNTKNDNLSIWLDGAYHYFYNCIIYDNNTGPYVILLTDVEHLLKSSLSINNTLLEFGLDAITVDNNCELFYDTTTNLDTNPIFLNMWEHPYMISDGSPCINTGTLAKLPDFIKIPEFDLAGNPRVIGDSIDMGAYEWNSTIVGINDIGPDYSKKEQFLRASPNPFEWETNIEVRVENYENINIEIFDNYGRKLKHLLTSHIGLYNNVLKWNGTDDNGKSLPHGIYHVVMFSNYKEIASLKVVKR